MVYIIMGEKNYSFIDIWGGGLGQAQLKLGLDFTLILCIFGFSPFGLIELGGLNRFGLVYLFFYIFKVLLGRFSL